MSGTTKQQFCGLSSPIPIWKCLFMSKQVLWETMRQERLQCLRPNLQEQFFSFRTKIPTPNADESCLPQPTTQQLGKYRKSTTFVYYQVIIYKDLEFGYSPNWWHFSWFDLSWITVIFVDLTCHENFWKSHRGPEQEILTKCEIFKAMSSLGVRTLLSKNWQGKRTLISNLADEKT